VPKEVIRELHISSYSDRDFWHVEVVNDPKLAKKIAACGGVEVDGFGDSRRFRAGVECVLGILADAAGLRLSAKPRKRREYSEEYKEKLRERLAKARAARKINEK
jgi:hypothetical protein